MEMTKIIKEKNEQILYRNTGNHKQKNWRKWKNPLKKSKKTEIIEGNE